MEAFYYFFVFSAVEIYGGVNYFFGFSAVEIYLRYCLKGEYQLSHTQSHISQMLFEIIIAFVCFR